MTHPTLHAPLSQLLLSLSSTNNQLLIPIHSMDPSIWSKLPEDLLYKTISFLPLKSISSLRPTSKKFNSLLSTPHFLSLLNSSSSSSSSSFLILSHPQLSHRFLSLYNSSSDQWRNLPLSFPSSSLLSSSSGILLFSTSSSSFFVLNLLTNCSINVPSPTFPISSASLFSHSNSDPKSPHGFKIFVPDSISDSIHIYNSRSKSWAKFPGLPSVTHNSNSHQIGVSYRGSLLFTTPEPFSIIAFDSETGKWGPVSRAVLPNELTFVRLVSSGEKLYLVGGVGRDGISRSVRVWVLDEEEEVWEEVGCLPELMCRKFGSVCYHNYSHVYCVWHEGMICVCCVTWPEVLFFKVGRGSWHWLSKCPFLLDKWSCGFSWFSFVPDLYALV